jgi:hypothetical protein
MPERPAPGLRHLGNSLVAPDELQAVYETYPHARTTMGKPREPPELLLARAHVRTRPRHHSRMASVPRCAAHLRDGRPCNRTVEDGSEFCVHHQRLLDEHGAAELKRGLPRRKQAKSSWQPRIVMVEPEAGPPSVDDAVTADPSTVRPRLAEAAAGSLDEISRVLLEAATGATKKQWADFECECGRRKRVELPVADVRARVAAIELLLREGLGRAPQAEESTTPRIPRTVEEIEALSWTEMQDIAAVLKADEEKTVRAQLAALDDKQRRWFAEALAESAA